MTKNVVSDAYDVVDNYGRDNFHLNVDGVAPTPATPSTRWAPTLGRLDEQGRHGHVHVGPRCA